MENIGARDCHSAVRLLAVDHAVKNITVRNVRGTFYQYCVGFTKYYRMGDGVYGRFENVVVENCEVSKAPMLKEYKKDPVHRYPLFYFQTETRSENVTIRNVEREETDCPVPFVGAEEGADIGGVRLENIRCFARQKPVFAFSGYSEKSGVRKVFFDGAFWNGERISPEFFERRSIKNPFCSEIRLI